MVGLTLRPLLMQVPDEYKDRSKLEAGPGATEKRKSVALVGNRNTILRSFK
jgi:hypothetical protein